MPFLLYLLIQSNVTNPCLPIYDNISSSASFANDTKCDTLSVLSFIIIVVVVVLVVLVVLLLVLLLVLIGGGVVLVLVVVVVVVVSVDVGLDPRRLSLLLLIVFSLDVVLFL